MCLSITKTDEMLTAKEDITVYKVVRTNGKSLIRGFSYKANTLYRLRKALKVNVSNVHVTIKINGGKSGQIKKLLYGKIYAGFHSYDTPTGDPLFLSKLIKCTIPKGAKYYHVNGMLVSTSIRTGSMKNIGYSYSCKL